jgi:hypothetical protein
MGEMGFSAFLLFVVAGAAFLAVWLLQRFPGRSPDRIRQALIHFGLSLTLVWTAPLLVELLASGSRRAAVAGTFVLVLPALVYACLSAAWVLGSVHKAIAA